MNAFLKISEEVQQALAEKKPVVALESTIIAHGMPWPKNVETAKQVETIVRQQGAIPATIAIRNGFCQVGLSASEMDHLGNEKDVWKVSIRDMPYVLSQHLTGATTVASTMRIASWAGISVFVTGGIGGVHRKGTETFDISADLTEMAKTNVAVVSAGIKSILDIGLTLEYLETLGVPVVSLGQKAFPSFYSSKSGYESPLTLPDESALAKLLYYKWQSGLEGSVLVANTIPQAQEIPFEIMETHIEEALSAAERQQISGKKVTPFLLKYLAEKTEGESLEANIALIQNNAKAGAKLAVAYTELLRNGL